MNSHSCIKCHARYESEDVDAYLCDPCNATRKAVAAQLDKKFANRPKEPQVMTPLQAFDAAQKIHGRFLPVKL